MSDSAPVQSGAPASTPDAAPVATPATPDAPVTEAPAVVTPKGPDLDAASLRTLATVSKQNRELKAKLADFEAKVKAGETVAQTYAEKEKLLTEVQAKYAELEKLAENPAELVRKRGYVKDLKHWEALAEAYANPDKGGAPPEDPRISELSKGLQEMRDAQAAKEKAEAERAVKETEAKQAEEAARVKSIALDWTVKALEKEPTRWPLISNAKDVHEDLSMKVLSEVQAYVKSLGKGVSDEEADRLMAQGFDQMEKLYRQELEPFLKAIAPKVTEEEDDDDGGGIRTYMKDNGKQIPKHGKLQIDSSSRSGPAIRDAVRKPMQGGPSKVGIPKGIQPRRGSGSW
jgi:hypothetical protein